MGTHSIKSQNKIMSGEFPVIKSEHSLVKKHVTKERWDRVKDISTKTCGFTIAKACACAIEFDNQHCGIYAGDWDCYKDFSEIFDGFGLSPGITKQQRIDVEKLMSSALSKLTGDLAGSYYPLTGMDETIRQQLVDDHFLFVSGDRNLTVAG